MTTEQTNRGIGRALRAAFPHTIPVFAGFIILGIAYGVLMRTKGYGVIWAMLMSALCFCGSMQFVAITLLTAAFDPLQAFLMSLMVNARHLFYGISMLGRYRGLGWARPLLIFGLCDETFSIAYSAEPPEDVEPGAFYLAVTLLDYAYWVGGTLMGSVAGGFLRFDTTGLDFVLTALFVVLFVEQFRKPENRTAAIAGALATAACLVVFGAGSFVIPSMLLILAILTAGRKRIWH